MKLILKNFRCYTSKTFTLNDEQITLINGPSGQGKTTILLAIQFALFGAGNHKYLVSHSQTSCEVILEFKQFRIKRTKRPNILNVSIGTQTYEDEEAQFILNKHFGFIKSNHNTFFMDLSHQEKMSFLEQLTCNDCDILDLKLKIKNKISDIVKDIAVLDGQLDTTSSLSKLVPKPMKVEKPIYPVQTEFDCELEKSATSEQISGLIIEMEDKIFSQSKIKEKIYGLNQQKKLISDQISVLTLPNQGAKGDRLGEKVRQCELQVTNLKEREVRLMRDKERFLVESSNIEKLSEELKQLSNEDCELSVIDTQIDDLNNKLNIYEKFQETLNYVQKQQEYDKHLLLEKQAWEKELGNIDEELETLNSKIDHQLDETAIFKKILNLEDAISFNQKYNLDDLEHEIRVLLSQKLKPIQCCNCSSTLFINTDTLDVYQDKLEGHSKDTKLNLSLEKLKKLKDSFILNQNIIEKDGINLSYWKEQLEYLKLVKQQREKRANASLFKMSKTLKKLEKDLKHKKALLDVDEGVVWEGPGVDVLKDLKRDLTIRKNSAELVLKRKRDIETRIAKIKHTQTNYCPEEHAQIKEQCEYALDQLQQLRTQLEQFRVVMDLESKLENIQLQLDKLKNEVESEIFLQKNLEYLKSILLYHSKYKEYVVYQTQLKKYKQVKEKMTSLIKDKDEKTNFYHKMLIFKQKVIESEHESFKWIIDSINAHLHLLLENFFVEEPMQIYLELSTTDSKRPHVNTVINYKGNLVDYKSLSAGEYARVKLAFDLTFKEMFGEKIIMLDECTANLDQDLSTKIFHVIRDSFPNKTILVVAHQVVSGPFDDVLML